MSSGLVKLACSRALPGRPGSARLDSETVQLTVAVAVAGSPGGIANWLVSITTTGAQSSPSCRNAARALACPVLWAAAAVSEIDACRAASLAAASTDPCAMVVRPAAMTSPSEAEQDGCQDHQLERGVAFVRAAAPRPCLPPARHGVNSSTGACTVSDTLTTSPGTKLGTWPVTVIEIVALVLPVVVARGSSR